MRKPLCLALLTVTLVGCKSADIKSFQSGDELTASTEGEKRLWHQSVKFDSALKKSNQIPDLPELRVYLQGIMDKLYPEFKGQITVNLHKAPVLNAFALPNGSIYINMGMLASLENEAQVATVLAHEGIHFLQKHSAKQRAHRHNSQGMALAVSMLGVPLIGQIAAASAISGYSVEHETESDNLGYERLVQAGYAASESARAFEILAREAKANDRDEPFFFASHPKLQERIDNFNALNAKNPKVDEGVVGFDTYQKQVGPLRQMILEQKLAAGKTAAVLAALEDPASEKLYQGHRDFLIAKALLKKDDEESHEKAVELLKKELKGKKNRIGSHRELGFYYFRQEDSAQAKHHLSEYIAMAGSEEDTAFAEYYLKKLK